MALPASFLEELRARIPPQSVIGRRVRLARSGKQWKGCCPFHGEKTPSFYVYEDGYHCFGCGAHGDVISFVMQSQGLGFMEAVEQLAAEAGLDVPKPTPEAAAAEQRRLGITEVLAAAEQHFRRRLALPEGRAARDYLSGRGLTEETIARYGLGWVGERGVLTAELRRDGIEPAQLEEAGLLRRDEDGDRTFELFSNRVMFPIRDRRGTTISFGGRILGSGQPKYVNGPETPAFSKRRTLFGMDQARGAVRNGAALVVVEGYMDVIAAAQAGFGGAVAPLGTALTGEQLEELWRVSPSAILCFDGDAAGGRAAARAMTVALPMLTTQRSLRFATLPADEDPDSLVRKRGAQAFQDVLNAAKPPADALYDAARAAHGMATPEQRASLRAALVEAANLIGDKVLASEYRRVLLDRFFAETRAPRPRYSTPGNSFPGPSFPGPSFPGRSLSGRSASDWAVPNGKAATPPRIVRTRIDQAATQAEWSRILTAILLRHPALLHDVHAAYATLALEGALARVRDALFAWAETAETLDSEGAIAHLTEFGRSSDFEQVLAAGAMPLPACAQPGAMPADAEAGWWHFFGFLNVDHLREEVALAKLEADRNLTADTQRRLSALRQALLRVESGEADDSGLAEAS
ncbi:DNA primase [Rhodopila sp.]|uniref:DNA primase n=1 Tax=Rhodopila sp. TaxID=2480087 RepID=UPI002C6AC622|nr:DNA primase [Rhodopila sp.]HVZ09641.1 DNA primase [Rhodopila sp.]